MIRRFARHLQLSSDLLFSAFSEPPRLCEINFFLILRLRTLRTLRESSSLYLAQPRHSGYLFEASAMRMPRVASTVPMSKR
jgi:hypothetical protein